MDQIFENTLLFDFYGELLTDRQKELFTLYHQDDLSLGEISEQLNISRQGVYDAIKRCDVQLHHFEDKLQLVHKYIRNKERIEQIHALALAAGTDESHEAIRTIAQAILNDL